MGHWADLITILLVKEKHEILGGTQKAICGIPENAITDLKSIIDFYKKCTRIPSLISCICVAKKSSGKKTNIMMYFPYTFFIKL